MFTLNVDVKVALHTGAEIMLTDVQKQNVTNYVVETLLGAKSAPKELLGGTDDVVKQKRRVPSYRHWTASEVEAIQVLVDRYSYVPFNKKSKDRQHDLKKMVHAHMPYRSYNQAATKYSELSVIARAKKSAQADARSGHLVTEVNDRPATFISSIL